MNPGHKNIMIKLLEETDDQFQNESNSDKILENGILIEHIGLSKRGVNCLKREGYNYVSELIDVPEEVLLNIRNMGITTMKEIKSKLSELELKCQYNIRPNSDEAITIDTPIDKIGLSKRGVNCLKREGYNYVSELIDVPEEVLMNIRNMGITTMKEIKNKLSKIELEQQCDIKPNSEEAITIDTPIEKLGLSKIAVNCLKREGYNYVSELINVPEEVLMNKRNIGIATVKDIKSKISKMRLTLQNPINYSDHEDETIIENARENLTWDAREKLFWDKSGNRYQDIPIEELGLSVRSCNTLLRNGYFYVSEIAGLSYDELLSKQKMGKQGVEEIRNLISNIQIEPCKDSDIIEDKIIDNLKNTIHEKLPELHLGLFLKKQLPAINEYLNNVSSFESDILKDDRFIDVVINNQLLKETIRTKIISLLKEDNRAKSLVSIGYELPSFISNHKIVHDILEELIDEEIIILTNYGYRKKRPTVLEYAKNVKKDRPRDILERRLHGNTLEEIGKEHNITRERVRQIVIESMKWKPELEEDRYIKVFEKYYFEEKDFILGFNETKYAYNYLNTWYKRGNLTLEDLVLDLDMPVEFRRAADLALSRRYLIIGNERIKYNTSELVKYVLRTYFQDESTYDTFLEIYHMFLEDNGLANDSKYHIDERSYYNKFIDAEGILWKFGKRLRYYDFEQYDFSELIDTLAFDRYSNVEYSSLKFFREYPELMREYDIRDEYELHNLLKKLYRRIDNKYIQFGRMPIIQIGSIDRDAQVLELLMKLAPIGINELADAYEKEYGVLTQTVKANYLKNFDKYYHEGIHTINVPELPDYEVRLLKSYLTNDFYMADDMKKLYRKLYPSSDKDMINPHTIKSLGFLIYSNYVISNRFNAAIDYYRYLLLTKDIINTDEIPQIIRSTPGFSAELYRLKHNFEIIEFQPHQFINISKLESIGISKKMFKEYCDLVFNTIDDGAYFTIKSLKKEGFTHVLDDLGFDDWFYASLITEDLKRFAYQRTGKTKIFLKGNGQVSIKSFVEFLLGDSLSKDIFDIKLEMEEEYGIILEVHKIISSINESTLHYDPIMEKIYIDYDAYFEEV